MTAPTPDTVSDGTVHIVERPCTNCGLSDRDCLDTINRANGYRCCGDCGLFAAHLDAAEPTEVSR